MVTWKVIVYVCPEIRGNLDRTGSTSRVCVFFFLDTKVFRAPDDTSVKETVTPWLAVIREERGQGQKVLELPPSPQSLGRCRGLDH